MPLQLMTILEDIHDAIWPGVTTKYDEVDGVDLTQQKEIAEAALHEVMEALGNAAVNYIVLSRHYRYTASAGRVTFGGLDDDNVYMYIQPQNVRVFVDGILRSDIDNLDASAIDLKVGVSAGDSVVIVSKFLYSLAEDGSLIEYPMSDDITISNEQYLASEPTGYDAPMFASPAFTPSATGSAKLYWDNQNWAYYINPNTGNVVEIDQSVGIPDPDTFLEGNYHTVDFDFMHLFTTQRRLTAEEIGNIESDYNILWEVLFNGGELSEGGFSLSDIHLYYPATEGLLAREGAVQNLMWQPEDQKIVFYIGPGQGHNGMYINAALDGEYYFDGVLRVGSGSDSFSYNQPNSRHEIYDPNHVITSIRGVRWYGYCPDFTGSYNLESVDIRGFVNDGMVGEYPNVDGCSSLTYLNLFRNHFDGGLDSILDRDSLVELNIGQNYSSTGTFRIDGLTNLETLTVAYNNWYQQFPDMDTHGALKYVNAYKSYFNGTPPKLSPYMEYCKFDNTKLVGQLPDMNDSIQEFYANNISGITALGSFLGAINLKTYRAYSCSVSSTLPSQSELNSCVLLEDFQIQKNRITGTHPVALNLSNLKIYSIYNNNTMTPSPLTDFSGCTSLETIDAGSTSISGGVTNAMIPTSIKTLKISGSDYYDGDLLNTDLLSNLITFDFRSNPNAVVTPRDFDFSNNPNLNYFRTELTPMAGSTLSNFNSCANFASLYINGCGYSGDMPDMDLSKMNILYANGNQFANSTLPALRVGQQYWQVGTNLMTYDLAELAVYPDLKYIAINNNLHTSNLPSFPPASNVTTFLGYENVSTSKGDGITGSIPDMELSKLTDYKVYRNNIGPNLGDISLCPNLVNFWAQENNISTYTGITLPTKLTSLRLKDNALTLAAVDEIIFQMLKSVESVSGYDYRDNTTTTSAYVVGDIVLDISNGKWYQCKLHSPTGKSLTNTSYWTYKGKVRTGTLSLEGGTNATPSAAGLANASQLTTYGWTVTTN